MSLTAEKAAQFLNLDSQYIETRLPFQFAKRYGVFIQSKTATHTLINHAPGLTWQTVLELQRYCGNELKFQALAADEFEKLLAQAYETATATALQAVNEMHIDLNEFDNDLAVTEDLLESEAGAPIVRLLNAVLTQAIKQLASDIHFEVFEDKLIIRFRVDGLLREALQPPRSLAAVLVSRLKIMAKLDIAEKRLPQDGRISLRVGGRAIDVRVSTIPTQFGERIVLRLLDKQSAPLDLKKLGMSPATLQRTRSLITQAHGVWLVTGPTGSGKTTTLYAALSEIDTARLNVLTVEDPIEYYLQGVGQTQANAKIGMTFARGLRAILRQDPDVVMVGEVRDLETAKMVVQASLTGHLVLSTLHTNSGVGAITRLRDMGIEPFLLSSTLVGVAAQRLVRMLCKSCKKPKPLTTVEAEQMNCGAGEMVYTAAGCEQCGGTGYQGRSGIYEVIAIDDNVRRFIHLQQSEAEIINYVRKTVPSMRQDGWRKVKLGETTIEEVLRVTAGED